MPLTVPGFLHSRNPLCFIPLGNKRTKPNPQTYLYFVWVWGEAVFHECEAGRGFRDLIFANQLSLFPFPSGGTWCHTPEPSEASIDSSDWVSPFPTASLLPSSLECVKSVPLMLSTFQNVTVLSSSHIPIFVGSNLFKMIFQFRSVQSLSRVPLFATPWTAARQASLSITNSQSLLKLMPIEWMMP